MGTEVFQSFIMRLNKVTVLLLILGIIIFSNVSDLIADVPEGQGETLQLYSGWTTSPPTFDGFLVTTSAEWDDAYARELPLSDGSVVTLFLMNDATNLYVGVSYPHGNNGSPNRVTLYFDQGNGGGENNDQLDVNNENMVSSDRSMTVPYDRYWNGSSWVDDGSIDFLAADDYFTNVFQWEFRIPLNNGSFSDLDVNGGNGVQPGDELGFLLEIFKQPGSTVFWSDTNMNPNNSSTGAGWGEIRLGTNPRLFRTLGASVNVNGNPSVDGSIGEDAYRGCYQRDLVLTNYHGQTFNARMYGVHAQGGNNVYIGIRVWDPSYHSGDYMQIYFEQDNPGPTDHRDYLLDDNQETSLRVTSSGATTDYFFERVIGSTGYWRDDASVGDPISGHGDSSYSSGGGYWDFEFRVEQNAGLYDLDRVLDDALLGFLVEYHDADQPTGTQEFYWDVTANSDVEYLDETGNNSYSIGWAFLQLGAPYLQIVHPENNLVVEGTYPVDAYVVPGTGASITNVEYQVEGDAGWKSMVRVATSDWWTGNWDTTTKPDGNFELRVRATDSNGMQVTQILNISINNTGGANAVPQVTITAPAPGATINGTEAITFDIDVDSGVTINNVEISVDGSSWQAVSNMPSGGANWDDGSHDLDTLTLANGAHIFRVRAEDSNGRWGYSEARLVIVSNNVSVTLTSPTPGSVVNGDSVQIDFDIDPELNETIVATEISIDGDAWTTVTTQPTSGAGWDDGFHTWDTLPVENGTHTIQVRAQDSNGRWGYSALQSVIVSNNVVVALTAPNGGSVVNGDDVSITFTIDPETNETITNAEISVDGGAWVAVSTQPTSGGNWDDGEHILDTLPMVNGSHTIQIRAEDSNGRMGYSELRTIVVSNNIDVEILTPAASSVVSGDDVQVTFTIDPELNETITSTQISIDGGAWVDVTTMPTDVGDWDDGDYIWNTVTYFNASHTLQIRAQDSNGRWGYSAIVLVIVNNEIEVNITEPAASEIVSGAEVNIAFTIDPVAGEVITKTEISIDGAEWIEVTSAPTEEGEWDDGFHTWDTTLIPDGSHTFIIRAMDSHDRYGYSVTRLVLVDNTAPVISNVYVKYPYGKTTVVTGDEIIITASIYDVISGLDDETVMVDTVEIDGETHMLYDDGTNGDEIEGDGVYSVSIIVTVHGNSTLPLTVSVSDNEGNAAVNVKSYVDIMTRTKATGGGCSLGDGNGNYTGLFILGAFMFVLLFVRRWGIPKSVALVMMVMVLGFAVTSKAMADDDDSWKDDSTWLDDDDDDDDNGTADDNKMTEEDDDEGMTEDDDEMMDDDDEGMLDDDDEMMDDDDEGMLDDDDEMSLDDDDDEIIEEEPQTMPQSRPKRIVDYRDLYLRSPLMFKTNDFLHSIISVPTMEIARTLDVGQMYLRFGYNYSSMSFDETKDTSSINTDAYFGETFLYFALGLTENLEVRAMLPYSGWNGDLELINNGQSVFEQAEVGDGLGSVRLGAKFFIHEFDFGLQIGGALTVKLPSGSKEDYQTTDAMDFSPALLFDYELEKYTFHLNLGYTFVGTQSVFRDAAEVELANVFFFGLGINYLVKEDIAIVLQMQGNTSTLSDVELDAVKGFIFDALLGARFYLPDNIYIEVGFGMGLTEPSAGFIMHLSLVLTQF